jgi:hypothetical protein
VELEDGTHVKGFICEPAGLKGAQEITDFGGWRSYLANQERPVPCTEEATEFRRL